MLLVILKYIFLNILLDYLIQKLFIDRFLIQNLMSSVIINIDLICEP